MLFKMLIGVLLLLMCGCGSGGNRGGAFIQTDSSSPAHSAALTISGSVKSNNVGLAGVNVTISGSGGSYTTITDSNGNYVISGSISQGNYTVSSALAGFTFTTQSVDVDSSNAIVGDITATAVPTFTVSGHVAASGAGLSGVAVTLSGGTGLYSGMTDSAGNFAIAGIQNGTYTATMSLVGYSFTPQEQSVVVDGAAATVSDVTATVVPPAKVYVIAKSAAAVLRINANTLAVDKTINLGVTALNSIAVVNDTLWYSWGDQWGYIGRYNLTTDVNETKVISSIYAGLLRSSAAQPGILFVGEQGLSPADIQKYDISVNPPVLLATLRDVSGLGSNLGDFKISADGSKIWTACGAPYLISETRTSDMTLTGRTFDTGPYPSAVDHTLINGSEILVGGTYSPYATDIHVFKVSDGSKIGSFDTGKQSNSGNVAISQNGTAIYSVHPTSTGSQLVTLYPSSGTLSRVAITTSSTFNSGIAVDYLSGRVFVATLDSVSVFDGSGKAVGKISSVAGASAILVVAP